MIEVCTVVAGRVRDRAEADSPEAAILAAAVLLAEARDAGCARPTASFYTDGVLVREGVTNPDTTARETR